MGNLSSNQIGGIVFAISVFTIIVVLLLTNKKDSSSPTTGPTFIPTMGPTFIPTTGPTFIPTMGPSFSPTTGPSFSPTTGPSFSPTTGPSGGLTQFFYDGNTGKVLSQDNPCYTCSRKTNPCGCYLNRNCSSSPDGFVIPDACNKIPCLRYETQDENGGKGTCSQAGLDLYRNAINSDTNSGNSYLCQTSGDKVQNCKTQCEQNDGPFSSVPFCSGCCEQACETIDCSSYSPSGRRTFPPGTTAPCNICKQVCAMSPEYCDRCKDENGC